MCISRIIPIKHWCRFKRCKRFEDRRDNGFTLIEMVIALSITGFLLLLGFSMWLSAWRTMEHETSLMQSLDDEWGLYLALTRDLSGAMSVQTDGTSLTVVLNDGEVSAYRLSPTSHLMLRTLNGMGEVVVSSAVTNVTWQVSQNDLFTTVWYEGDKNAYEAQFTLSPYATAF